MARQRSNEKPSVRPRGADRKPVLLRLSPELHEQLRIWANQEMRSLNAHMEFILRQAVNRRRGEG